MGEAAARGPGSVGRKPDFARPTSRPIAGRNKMQSRAAPKRSGGGTRRAERVFPTVDLPRAGFEPSVGVASRWASDGLHRRSIVDHFGYLIGDGTRTARLKTDASYVEEGGCLLGASSFSPYRSRASHRRFTRSPVRPFAHSPIRPFAHSPIRPFAHSPVRPFAHSPIRPFAHSPIRIALSAILKTSPATL
jgi:hypothetical protein